MGFPFGEFFLSLALWMERHARPAFAQGRALHLADPVHLVAPHKVRLAGRVQA